MMGHCGQGLFEPRSAGGLGMISKFTSERQPWRSDVPMQSVPVSPPPMTMTLRSFALM